MCTDQQGPGVATAFDPTRCPLLQGLSVEDADRMMASDPRINACRAAIDAGRPDTLEPCVAKMVRAHDAAPRRTRRKQVA